jgi:type IV secretory pathway protease TraF
MGLYFVHSPGHLRFGDMVVAWLPPEARRLAASRHYLPRDVPLVKRVAALGGSLVCAHGRRLWIDGRLAAQRLARDPSGRAMPRWNGCRKLRSGELLLLSRGVLLAFDGRYFGITKPDQVIGKASLVWAR